MASRCEWRALARFETGRLTRGFGFASHTDKIYGAAPANPTSITREPPGTQPTMSSRIPSGTYRLQLHRDFTLKDATALLAYLHDLGISDCYLSPITEARAGSPHGYDVIDHGKLNPELGTEDDLGKFAQMLHERGMGIVQDIVPNHMWI